jgi:hypothetical protein
MRVAGLDGDEKWVYGWQGVGFLGPYWVADDPDPFWQVFAKRFCECVHDFWWCHK